MYNSVETKRFAYMFDPKRYTSIMNKDDVYPLKKVDFEKMKVSIYKNVCEYLSVRYGDYMTLPPEGKRHNHPPYSLKFHIDE